MLTGSRRFFLKQSLALAAAGAGTAPRERSARGKVTQQVNVAQAPLGRHADESRLSHFDIALANDHLVLSCVGAQPIEDARPGLWWRKPGESAWVGAVPKGFEDMRHSVDGHACRVVFENFAVELRLRKFAEGRLWRLAGTLHNTGAEPIELARFHYLHGRLANGTFLELNGGRGHPALRTTEATVAPGRDVEEFWKGMGVEWPRASDPIADEKGWFTSVDYAAFAGGWDEPGWGFGFVAPGNAFGEIGYRRRGEFAEVYAGVNLDGVTLASGQEWVLEECLVWRGDLQAGMALWSEACARELGACRPPQAPLVGYCSWYQLGGAVREPDFERASSEFAAWPRGAGGRVIQLDAGWEDSQGSWQPNEKFPDFASLPARIAATGSIPGLWIAPLMVAQSDPIVTQHPDWLQRLDDGRPAVTFPGQVIGGKASKIHFLDPDHPQVQSFIASTFERLCKQGWRYFKVDFTYAVTAARHAPGRKKTSFQSQRDLYRLIRATVGPDVLINACIGEAGRYVLGSADVARVGDDASFNLPSVKQALHQNLSRFAVNGVWFQADADVFSMRTVDSKLSREERCLLTRTVGLSGGVFLTSDLPSQWTAADAAVVREFWNARGPRVPQRQRLVWTHDGEIIAYAAGFGDDKGKLHYRVALYNWSDQPRDIQVSLHSLAAPATSTLSSNSRLEGVSLTDGQLRMRAQPPGSLRIVELT